MPRRDAHADAGSDEAQHAIELARARCARPMQGAQQKQHRQRRKRDPLEDA